MDAPGTPPYLDCTACKEACTECGRAEMHCGFLSEQSWSGSPPLPNGYPDEPSCCPGYLVSMPIVQEASRARFWAERGMLRDRYDGHPLTEAVFEAVEQLEVAYQEVESYELDRARDEMKART
jgi:hypothetical protein